MTESRHYGTLTLKDCLDKGRYLTRIFSNDQKALEEIEEILFKMVDGDGVFRIF